MMTPPLSPAALEVLAAFAALPPSDVARTAAHVRTLAATAGDAYTLHDAATALAELAGREDAERFDLIVAALADGEVSGVSFYGGVACVYRLDGTDTDGTPWHQCLTHDALEISAEAPCGNAS